VRVEFGKDRGFACNTGVEDGIGVRNHRLNLGDS